MILAVAHTKGGTGKTTTAIQLALYRKLIDRKEVWLVDGDTQRSALTAITMRSENASVQPDIPCSAYSVGRDLLNQVKIQRDKWDDVILDIGGRDTETLRAALMICDVLLVPVQPRQYDIWAIDRLRAIVQEAHNLGANFKAYCFLSCADAQGTDNEETKKAILENFSENFGFIDAPLVRRKSFSTASSFGVSVFELTPSDQKAQQEIEKLAKIVFTSL